MMRRNITFVKSKSFCRFRRCNFRPRRLSSFVLLTSLLPQTSGLDATAAIQSQLANKEEMFRRRRRRHFVMISNHVIFGDDSASQCRPLADNHNRRRRSEAVACTVLFALLFVLSSSPQSLVQCISTLSLSSNIISPLSVTQILPHSPKYHAAHFISNVVDTSVAVAAVTTTTIAATDANKNAAIEPPYSSNLCDRDGTVALGMQSGQIPDSALSASSAYEVSHVGPQFARLKTDNAGGAWCPQSQVGPNKANEWIQVNLNRSVVITGVATQGRYGGGIGLEFTETFRIFYSRQRTPLPTKWIAWKSWDGSSNLDGNIDPNTVAEHHLEPPIVGARHIRLVPLSLHTRTVCLRFELFGCSYQGPISYRSPVGGSESDDGRRKTSDDTYDGVRDGPLLIDGLGKLVDGVKSSSHESADSLLAAHDTRWISWRPPSNASHSPSVQLEFEFDQVLNFTTVSINCLNSYSRQIRVFTAAFLWFSLDRRTWSATPIRFEYQPDNVMETPRDIIIHLQYRIGRFVRIELTYHRSASLQVSEFTFDTRTLPANLSDDSARVQDLFERIELFGQQANDDALAGGGTRYVASQENSSSRKAGGADGKSSSSSSYFPVQDQATNSTLKYSLIIGCLFAVGLVVISLLTLLAMRKLNNRKNNVFREISDTDLESENATINLKNLPKDGSPLYCEPKELSQALTLYSTAAALPTSGGGEAEYAIPDVICAGNLSKTLSFHASNKPLPPATIAGIKTLQINPRFYDSSDIGCPNKQNIYGNRPSSQILNVFDIANLRTLDPRQQLYQQSQQQQQQSNQPNLPQQQKQQLKVPLLDTFGGGGRRQSANIRSSFYGQVSGNNGNGHQTKTTINGAFGVRVYSESEIGVLQSLGKSKYGDILLCNIPTVSKNRLAVVRTVNDLAQKNEFHATMQFARQLSLHCDKFARLFGVIETASYFASITEYADCDLNYFLRKSTPDHLSFETLLYIASEIASAGAYLESCKQTHRDIASRNVIVYEKNLTVKLTDVAMFVDAYAADYYNGLPIRWMSPEAIVRTQFTVQSDVYAFGVCFWEILTLGKCRPFADLADEDFLATIYTVHDHDRDDDDADDDEDSGNEMAADHLMMMPRLPRPPQCSNEIFELLEECCNVAEDQRPTFKEICLFLQRKTLGFGKGTTQSGGGGFRNTLAH